MLGLNSIKFISNLNFTSAMGNYNHLMAEYFPEITETIQEEIFCSFNRRIEEENNKLTNFHESLINYEDLIEFNESPTKPKISEVFAIDLGGSSLKITTVKISFPDSNVEVPEFEALDRMIFSYEADPELKKEQKIKWYEWTVEKIIHYLEATGRAENLKNAKSPYTAAFTFSYHLKQLALDSAIVAKCHKTFYFSKENFIGSNVVSDLNAELQRRKINIKINCILNDVVATYAVGVANRKENPIALIVGTGTNLGFKIESSKENKIINSEMAQYPIDKKYLDRATLEIVEESNNFFFPLEVMVAGMKFVEKIQKAIRALYRLKEEEKNLISHIDHEYINYCMNYIEGHCSIDDCKILNDIGLIEFVHAIVCEIKSRAYKILAPIIVSAAKLKNFTLIANGSVICNSLDIKILKFELTEFLKKKKLSDQIQFDIVENNDASLFGSAYVSLVYGNKKDEIRN